jgi:sugar phosphate isomerase/epimerase
VGVSSERAFHERPELAKDTAIDAANVAVNGVLDTKGYDKLLERSWLFRTVGYGHRGEDLAGHRQRLLRAVGCDYVMSIEHEDALASVDEGLSKAVRLLQEVLLAEEPADMWWA